MAGKSSVGARAAQFLTQIGTAGGPVGAASSPGLVGFGAGNLQEQIMAGNTDIYAAQRMGMGNPVVGSPSHQMDPGLETSSAMPANLSSSYLQLNTLGSPLPGYGLLAAHNLNAAQATQNQIRGMDQYMYMRGMNPAPPLPMDPGQTLPIVGAAASGQQLIANANRARGAMLAQQGRA